MSSSVLISCYSSHKLDSIIRSSKRSDRRSSHRLISTVDLKIPFRHFFGGSSFDIAGLQNGRRNAKMDTMKVNDNILPDVPHIPSNPSDPGSWKLWLVGIFLTVIIPFWQNKWGPLKKLQERVEKVVDTAQEVAEIVEDVAEGLEKVADEIGDSLPKGGKLQRAALFVEDLANHTVNNTNLLEHVLDQVEAVENKLEDFLEEQMDESEKEKIDEKSTHQTTEPGSLSS